MQITSMAIVEIKGESFPDDICSHNLYRRMVGTIELDSFVHASEINRFGNLRERSRSFEVGVEIEINGYAQDTAFPLHGRE